MNDLTQTFDLDPQILLTQMTEELSTYIQDWISSLSNEY